MVRWTSGGWDGHLMCICICSERVSEERGRDMRHSIHVSRMSHSLFSCCFSWSYEASAHRRQSWVSTSCGGDAGETGSCRDVLVSWWRFCGGWIQTPSPLKAKLRHQVPGHNFYVSWKVTFLSRNLSHSKKLHLRDLPSKRILTDEVCGSRSPQQWDISLSLNSKKSLSLQRAYLPEVNVIAGLWVLNCSSWGVVKICFSVHSHTVQSSETIWEISYLDRFWGFFLL